MDTQVLIQALIDTLGIIIGPEERRPIIKQLKEAGVVIDWACGYSCVWRMGHDSGKCAAFPDGVPSDIANGIRLHNKPIPGDGGLVYSPEWKPLTQEQLALMVKHSRQRSRNGPQQPL
jgi:hypothetical protein